jgi:hypothetical protein
VDRFVDVARFAKLGMLSGPRQKVGLGTPERQGRLADQLNRVSKLALRFGGNLSLDANRLAIPI